MLDIKFIRENPEAVKKALRDRASKLNLDELLALDESRRRVLAELEELRSQRNKANDEISVFLKEKKDPQRKISSMKEISGKIGALETSVKEFETKLGQIVLTIPNIPHSSVPVGEPDKAQIVRSWGKIKEFSFKPVTHIELSQHLDIIDFARATKITGTNFVLYKGLGAQLERALINFMLELHTQKHGYTEVSPPFLVNRKSMTGTGQLPKMEEDMYKLKDDDLFLIPTAEVPVTNMYSDELFDESILPRCLTAYTPCFRREAGSYGKDTKGLLRVHQFDKVEMVKFVKPESSYEELEKLLNDAEEVLQLLGLPYRVKVLSTQDLSFAASKCYDIEAYAPGVDKWLEVSSCSNFESFQARRANIKFRHTTNEARRITEYVHTLNGSGVALARTVIAITIPEVLRPYLHGKERIP
jgi:seryl-tRNA synthetase